MAGKFVAQHIVAQHIKEVDMQANVIYFPYIKIPQGSWTTRVLLYWDTLASIVPYDYVEQPEALGDYMVGLLREQLVIQIIPGMHLWGVPNFAKAFLDYVDSNARRPIQNRELWQLIHMEKLQSLAEELHERGLAEKTGEKHSPWYKVETHTAQCFMAYLASVLGQIPDHDAFYPMTDSEANLAFLKQGAGQKKEYKLREILLEKILPTPLEMIEPAMLAEFKNTHRQLLLRFRRTVEEKISELSCIQSDQELEHRMQTMTDCMKDEIEEVTARMRERRWLKIDFATLCTLAGSGLSGWKAIIDKDWRFGLAGAALGLAGTVYAAFQGAQISLEDKPLAYASVLANEFKL
jgi:hypothetical protein